MANLDLDKPGIYYSFIFQLSPSFMLHKVILSKFLFFYVLLTIFHSLVDFPTAEGEGSPSGQSTTTTSQSTTPITTTTATSSAVIAIPASSSAASDKAVNPTSEDSAMDGGSVEPGQITNDESTTSDAVISVPTPANDDEELLDEEDFSDIKVFIIIYYYYNTLTHFVFILNILGFGYSRIFGSWWRGGGS